MSDLNQFSLFHNGITNTIPNDTINLNNFLELIKKDTHLFEQIRKCSDKKERDKLKSKLSYVTFGGTFSKRNANCLLKSSGLACLDIDGISNLEEVKEQILKDKYTHSLFVSPSGKGLKLIVRIPEVKSNEEYKEYWSSISKYFNLPDMDEGTKDISRACYVSYDPEPYINYDSEIYTDKLVQENSVEKITITKEGKEIDTSLKEILDKDKKVKELFEGYTENYKSRSEAEMSLVCHLIGLNLNKEQIFNVMSSCKIGKWQESNIQYRDLTYEKATKRVTREKNKKDKKPLTARELEEKIKIMLNYEKKPYQSMAIGEHNGRFYFGSIFDYGIKKVPAIITDDRQIYCCWKERVGNETIVTDQIRGDFKLNYRFELFDDCVDNLWSNKSIKEFLEGRDQQQDTKELFNIIRNKNQELVYHVDKRTHDYIACDIMSNYVYTLFNAKGRTQFQAEFGSGKSRQSLVYQKLSFNSLFASNISPASFERVIESTGGTIIVDNFDNVIDDLKRQILQVIEVYYKKGGKNIKSAGTGFEKNKPIAFNGYSPLVINNLMGLPEVTESRCNKIQMLKTEDKKVVDIRINERDPFWNETKDRLHLWALQNWKKVKEAYEKLEVKELSARNLEKAEAVLTIAKLVGEETYENVLSLLLDINEQQSIRDIQDDWAFIVYDFLNSVVGAGETKNIQINEITQSVGFKVVQSDRTEKTDKLKFSHYCGKVLSGVPTFRKKTIQGWVSYEISREALSKIIKIKGYDRYLTIPHPTSPNHTLQHQQHPQDTLIKEEEKEDTNKVRLVRLSEVGEVGRVQTQDNFEKINVVTEKVK